MARQAGYVVTIKAFVPSSKTDFKQQAAVATAMGELTDAKTLPANFGEIAEITEITAKYGSRDAPDAAA